MQQAQTSERHLSGDSLAELSSSYPVGTLLDTDIYIRAELNVRHASMSVES